MKTPFSFSVNLEKWHRWREEAYRTFTKDIEIGYVDKDIIPLILDIFNKCDHVFTISSCSGRITLVDALFPWQRRSSTVIFKKHEPMSASELKQLLTKPCVYRLWMISSGPIIHFVADSIESSRKLLSVARTAGFKHSGIISFRDDGIVIELISGNWICTLLKDQNNILIELDKLPILVQIFNENLLEGKRRLQRLHKAILEAFGKAP